MNTALNVIPRLFTWWIGALRDCVPAPLRLVVANALLAEDVNTAILFQADTIRVYAIENNAVRELGNAPSDDPKAVRSLVRRANRRDEIVVAVPHDRIMHRSVSFPKNAEADLASALQFVVEQVTPVKSEDAHWDWRVSRRDARAQTIDVELYVAPTWVVDEALGAANDLKIPLIRVDVLSADKTRVEHVNLARSSARFRFPRLKPGVVISLIFMVLALAGATHSAWRQDGAARQATAWAEQARLDAQPGLDERAALQRAEERLTLMIDIQSATAPASEVINELARILPDETWLFEMSTRGLEVNISGESDQASALLALIDASPQFGNARFTSAVTRGSIAGTERFVVSFDVADETTS